MKPTDKKIEQVATASLVPYAKNAKKHDAAQVAAIAGSIREFGFNNPVLIDADNGIIAGHGRVLAAHQLGLEAVPCLRLTHLSDTQKRAYILADNRLAEIGGGWDADMLAAELEALSADGITMEDIGFDADALEELGAGLGNEGNPEADAEPQIDKAEELRAKWGVEPGQLWELGDHRLLCGDSTKKEDVERVMGGERAQMAFQDPPYALFGNSTGMAGVADDKMIRPFFRDIADRLSQAVRRGGHIYSCCDWRSWCCVFDVFTQRGLVAKNMIVWDKCSAAMGQAYRSQHELLFFGIIASHDKTATTQQTGNSRQIVDGNVWQFKRVKEKEHNAQKPVELLEKAISNSSDKGGLVLDLFSGSGTSLIACEQLKRKCRTIEIEPSFVAVAIQRWADATGKTPKLVA
jgi:DNA modification methylase